MGRELDEFPVCFGLDEPVDIAISGVVPDALGFQFEGVEVVCLEVVVEGVSSGVPSTTDVSTNQANRTVLDSGETLISGLKEGTKSRDCLLPRTFCNGGIHTFDLGDHVSANSDKLDTIRHPIS